VRCWTVHRCCSARHSHQAAPASLDGTRPEAVLPGLRRHCAVPAVPAAVRCERLDIDYIDGMLLLPIIIEHTIGALYR
jgi:hypothetical protein